LSLFIGRRRRRKRRSRRRRRRRSGSCGLVYCRISKFQFSSKQSKYVSCICRAHQQCL